MHVLERIRSFRAKPGLHIRQLGGLEILKYIGPGFLVTVGFIDPGNWAANVAAGSDYGYHLLWVVTLSTIMLIILQHNVAHLGIVTGLCLAEAANKYFRPWIGKTLLISAVLAAVSTALAEILGAAIGLQMLFHLDLRIGVLLVVAFVLWMLFSNSYKKLERWIIGFVSLIGISFLVEVVMASGGIHWGDVLKGTLLPTIPPTPAIPGVMPAVALVMTVLGAVVMPHNLFLHSEIIQSRQWNLENDEVINRQLKYEFLDTLFSMIIGWAINSAMIVVAAAVFFAHGFHVTELAQAQATLQPLLGKAAAIIFALALLFAGTSSSVTAAMAGGSIYAGLSNEPYNAKDPHTRRGILITVLGAAAIIYFLRDPFTGLLISQLLLSIQLPWTIFMQIALTSSTTVMGKYANNTVHKVALWMIALLVGGLNLLLLYEYLRDTLL